jgi:hypothetical protein
VAVKIPTVEVHVTNIHARESFPPPLLHRPRRLRSLCGFGIDGYRLAIHGLAAKIGAQAKRLTPPRSHRKFGSRSWRASLTTPKPRNSRATTAR